MISIFVYIILMLAISIYFFSKNRWKLSAVVFIFIFLTFAAFCSLMYYVAVTDLVVRDYSNLTIFPFVYLVAAYLITAYPIVKYEDSNFIGLNASRHQRNILDFLSLMLAIASIEPFLETIVHLPTVMASSDSMSVAYEARMDGAQQDYLSFMGRKFFYLITLLEYITPILLFYQLQKQKINRWVVIGLVACILTVWLHGIALGGRSSLVQNALYLIVVYFLMNRFLPKEINTLIIKYGAIILSIAFAAIMLVTLSRFGSMDGDVDSIWVWLGLYAGEGPLNFNSIMWYVTGSTSGDRTFILLRNILDLTQNKTVEDVWHASSKLGIPGYIFYTYVGAIFYDFNRVGTMLFILIFSTITTVISRSKGKLIQVQKLIYVCLCAKILIIPTFYTYGTYAAQIQLLVILIICAILTSVESKKY